jgi:glutamyl-tRNA synthetase
MLLNNYYLQTKELTMSVLTTRFAPSPTGDLHVGGARTALYSWLFAKQHHGRFLLRIEDTDLARSTTAAAEGIITSMQWLGLDYQGEIVYQSQRNARYCEIAQQLLGNQQAYKCYCSHERLEKLREELLAAKQKPKYDGLCRNNPKLNANGPYVVRFKNPLDGDVLFTDQIKGPMRISNQELDDIIILRSDGTPTYNFTVVVDDRDQQITHVIRGDDHISNTPRQINILHALASPVPIYAHVPMILGSDGKRLSKRHGANGILEYRNLGFLPQALLNYLVRLGWSHQDQEVFSISDMIEKFDFSHVNKAPAAFDMKKLLWLNQHYIKTSSVEILAPELHHQYAWLKVAVPANVDLSPIINALRERAKTMVEMAEQSAHVFNENFTVTQELVSQYFTPEAMGYLQYFVTKLQAVPLWEEAVINAIVQQILEDCNIKIPQLAPVVRVALTGSANAPSIPATLQMIGRDKALQRLQVHLS